MLQIRHAGKKLPDFLNDQFLVALFMSSLKIQHFSIFHKKQIGAAAGVTNHLFPEACSAVCTVVGVSHRWVSSTPFLVDFPIH